VALAYFFDQVHFENTAHLLHLHQLKRALDAGHILFDHLTEKGIEQGRLARYRVVLLPRTACISDAVAGALETWVRGGGRLVLTGDLPAFYETARPRSRPVFSSVLGRARGVRVVPLGQGRLAWAPDIQEVAPIPGEERKLLYLSSTALEEAVARPPAVLPLVDRPLLKLLDSLAERRLAYTDRTDLPGLRATCYWRREGKGARLVIHLLNYDPDPARDVPVSLPLSEGAGLWKSARLRGWHAGAQSHLELTGQILDHRLRFRVPELAVHLAVEAEVLA